MEKTVKSKYNIDDRFLLQNDYVKTGILVKIDVVINTDKGFYYHFTSNGIDLNEYFIEDYITKHFIKILD